VKLIEQTEWHTHQLAKWEVDGPTDRPLSFITVMPTEETTPRPWIIALHGYTSSKAEWLEVNGYTKGGNLVRALADRGFAVVALDMDQHGDNLPADRSVDYDDLMNNGWEEFFSRTVDNLQAVIAAVTQDTHFDRERCGFLSYSLGGLFGYWLANRGAPFKTMALCVPPAWREDSDPYAPASNLDHLTDQSVLYIAAEHDEHCPIEDARWLYAQLSVSDKRFLSYPSGHSLPLDYVPAAVEWFTQHL
jgi:pimeloyl-ACP methyl ester carboxylesterase